MSLSDHHAATISIRWNDLALSTLFRRGLRKEVQTELACRDDNLSLDALHLDNLLRERRHSHRFSPSLSEHFGSEPEPMEVGVTRLPAAERRIWRQLGLCLYCGQGGHQLQRWPVLPNSGSTRAREQRDGHVIFHNFSPS